MQQLIGPTKYGQRAMDKEVPTQSSTCRTEINAFFFRPRKSSCVLLNAGETFATFRFLRFSINITEAVQETLNAVKLQVAVIFVVNAILEKFSRAFSLLVPPTSSPQTSGSRTQT